MEVPVERHKFHIPGSNNQRLNSKDAGESCGQKLIEGLSGLDSDADRRDGRSTR